VYAVARRHMKKLADNMKFHCLLFRVDGSMNEDVNTSDKRRS